MKKALFQYEGIRPAYQENLPFWEAGLIMLDNFMGLP
jgi:hypothetical protein